MFANALFLAIRNLGTFRLTVENIAEVDATGRYINASRQCAEDESPHAHFDGCKHIPTAWVSNSVCYCQGFLRPRIANEQKQDTPLSFYVVNKNNGLASPILGVCRT